MNKDNAKDYLPLVQALADGKVIQTMVTTNNGDFKWINLGETDFHYPPTNYRIKPELREIWVNVRSDGVLDEVHYPSKDQAAHAAIGDEVQTCYREVIE